MDESVIPYYGRHGAKEFIRGKPTRFGYKIWALITALGYVLQFEPYQGARGRQASDVYSLGIGGAVVMDLQELTKDNSYHLTFDNLFVSLSLVDELTKLYVGCTGTVRLNRIGDCPVRSVQEMSKTGRGTYDSPFDTRNGLVVVGWNDNSTVNIVSNIHSQPEDGREQKSQGFKYDNLLPCTITTKQWEEWMGWIKILQNTVGWLVV